MFLALEKMCAIEKMPVLVERVLSVTFTNITFTLKQVVWLKNIFRIHVFIWIVESLYPQYDMVLLLTGLDMARLVLLSIYLLRDIKWGIFGHITHLCPFSKSKFNPPTWSIKSDRVNHVAPASPVHRARYSTNCDRKGWPGSKIPMYYDWPWYTYIL